MAHTAVSSAFLLHLAIAMSFLVGVDTCMSTHPVNPPVRAPATTKPKTACAMCTNITVDQTTDPAPLQMPVTYVVEADSGCRTATVMCNADLMPYIVDETSDPEQLITAQDLALKCTAATMWEATYSEGMTKTNPKLKCAKACAACANVVLDDPMPLPMPVTYAESMGCRTVTNVMCSGTNVLYVIGADPGSMTQATDLTMQCTESKIWTATYTPIPATDTMPTLEMNPTLQCAPPPAAGGRR